MKNYYVKFMDKSMTAVTAEEAAKIAKDWLGGVAVVMIKGGLKATHQIVAIDPVSSEELKDLCLRDGIETKDAPRLENFLQSKKLLK